MELLAAGPEPAPRRSRPPELPLLLAALLVLVAGLAALPGARAAAQAARVVTAEQSGASAVHGRLRLWLLLRGAPGSELAVTGVHLPGLRATASDAPPSFSPDGVAVVRVDVQPGCPDGGAGAVEQAALRVRARGGEALVPFPAAGVLAETVQARCAGALGPDEQDVRPVVLPAPPAPASTAGALTTRVVLGAEGPRALVVARVLPGAGLRLAQEPDLPLVVPAGRVAELRVDLVGAGCLAADGEPPLVLVDEQGRLVEPRVDPALRGRVEAARRSACRGAAAR